MRGLGLFRGMFRHRAPSWARPDQFIFDVDTNLSSPLSLTCSLAEFVDNTLNTYNCVIDWGDGTVSGTITSGASAEWVHTYAAHGIYRITITGTIIAWGRTYNPPVRSDIKNIYQFGSGFRLRNSLSQFQNLPNLTISATDSFSVVGVSEFQQLFQACTFDKAPALQNLDTSAVTSFYGAFYNNPNFNEDVNNWDVSGAWNPNSFTNTFMLCVKFNQPLDKWRLTGGADRCDFMFFAARAFNQPIDAWGASMRSIKNLSYMFGQAWAFNQPIGSWDVSQVTQFTSMFNDARSFNQNLHTWDMSSAVLLSGMFYQAIAFNGRVDGWNTSNVTTMENMFNGATNFNQPLTGWDTSKVTTFHDMLTFTAFKQPLAHFKIDAVPSGSSSGCGFMAYTDDFNNASDRSNYDNLLISLATQATALGKTNIGLNVGATKYTAGGAAAAARATLVGLGWTISDGGT